MTTNTRRYPRTLHEAFPGSPEYACALEMPYKPRPKTWLRAIAATVALGIFTMLLHAVAKVLA